jgi:hypothetical protein
MIFEDERPSRGPTGPRLLAAYHFYNFLCDKKMKPSILPASRRGVSRQGFIPEDVIPASRGWVSAEAIKPSALTDTSPTES